MAQSDTYTGLNLNEHQESELLAEAKDRYKACEEHYDDQYRRSTEDWEFLHGIGQWDVGSDDQRRKEGRPSLTLNQLLPYAQQAINDIKQARLAIRVVPIDSEADVELADLRAGIIRNIEKQSKAKNVYGTAAMNAIGAGIGWMRVTTDYADLDTFDQEALIERVLDFSSVMLDPQSKTLDGSDAEFGFVKIGYTKERYEELYPDNTPVSFDDEMHDEDIVVVEYYYKEYKKETIYQIEMQGQTFIIDKEQKSALDDLETAYEEKANREIQIPTVYHCLLNGHEIMHREEFPSIYIPLIPVIGEEVYINEKRECHSLISQAKDAQRMYNYWKSYSTETIALQTKTPWIAPVGSFKSFPNKWRQANTQNYASLEYDVVFDKKTGQPLPPPTKTPPATANPALFQEAAAAREDIRLAIGMNQSNMGERSNAVSGVAIRNQQIEGDNATFHFVDNLSTSIAQVGRILNDIIPALYSERKTVRIIGEEGDEESVMVNTPYVEDENGYRPPRNGEQPQGNHDLSIGKYDIDMDVGASYSSKRQETADKMIEIAKVEPRIIEVAGDLIFEALDLPMAKQIAERLKSSMPPEYLDDDPMAAKLQQAASQVEGMQEQLLNMEAALKEKQGNEQFDQSIKVEELKLEREELAIKAAKTAAEIEKIRQETAGFDPKAMASMINAVTDMNTQMSDISQAMEIMFEAKEQEQNKVTVAPEQNNEQAIEGEDE